MPPYFMACFSRGMVSCWEGGLFGVDENVLEGS